MSTVRDALDMLNEQLHERGFHADMVNMELLPESDASNETYSSLIRQTFDWRYEKAGITKPTKDKYTVKLTADDVRTLGRALDVYEHFLNKLYVEPALKRIITKMGEVTDE